MSPAPMPPSLSDLRDSLDSVWVDYLAALDELQHARVLLHEHLQKAHFDLARAKLALGPGRLSRHSYDLSDRDAQTQVWISASTLTDPFAVDTDRKPAPPPATGGATVPSASLTWTIGPRAPKDSPSIQPEPVGAVAAELRHRSTSRRAGSAAIDDEEKKDGVVDDDALETEAVPPPRPAARSPLIQFSALPPPALRSAAEGFTRAVQAVARVVELERGLRDQARRVKRARREVERCTRTPDDEEEGEVRAAEDVYRAGQLDSAVLAKYKET